MGCYGSSCKDNGGLNTRQDKSNKQPGKSQQKYVKQYDHIDEHARKAPQSLRNSVTDLITYMKRVSNEPRMLVRGFFVWISQNVSYDVDGYFGRTNKAACDFQSVMRTGKSVCSGYASVFEALCKEAGIPVKNISGYSKGYHHSADKPFTTDQPTDHAWNAVQLEGKWYLVDSTWGAGYLDGSNRYKMEFDDFFFLTDPQEFIYSHFPYMGGDMNASKQLQLLGQPWDINKFNKSVHYKSKAFQLGAKAVSHKTCHLEVTNEVKMSFCSTKEEIAFKAELYEVEPHVIRQIPKCALVCHGKKECKIRVRCPKEGKYKLFIFGKLISDESSNSIPELMEYSINCVSVKEKEFRFPMDYRATSREKCILIEPINGRLKANTEVQFRLQSPYLKRVMVEKMLLQKNGNTFSGSVTTGSSRGCVNVYGSREETGTLQGLYTYDIL